MNAPALRHDWTLDEIRALLDAPFLELVDRARAAHKRFHDPSVVQLAQLANIKPGGCAEDCAYCPQAARYDTGVKATGMMSVDEVVAQATAARDRGVSRFCMGAAWRQIKDGAAFDRVVEMVQAVNGLGLESCVTAGMLEPHHIQRLADAGLYAYNHNLDTSRERYADIITTRTYDDRLRTLGHVRQAGVTVCCGGIIGMGEEVTDRASLLHTLATMNPHPDSVPINKLIRVAGTPLAEGEDVDVFDFLRVIAVARVLMPAATIRLSAGRTSLSREAQALAFLCGANSIFYGDRLLTAENPGEDEDLSLLRLLGLTPSTPRPASP
jgi:biotin synthase